MFIQYYFQSVNGPYNSAVPFQPASSAMEDGSNFVSLHDCMGIHSSLYRFWFVPDVLRYRDR